MASPRFSRLRLRSHRAASGVDYGLIVGLIAVVGLGAVTVLGGKVNEIFGGAETAMIDSGSSGG